MAGWNRSHLKKSSCLQTQLRDSYLLNKIIVNYAKTKMIYVGCVPQESIYPISVHRSLSHLMEYKAHGTKYLTTSPERRMPWFTAFLNKYYL
jgi:hypothetical protein